MEATTLKPSRLAVVVSDADAVEIEPTTHATADDATDDAAVNATNNNNNNNNTVDFTADMAALEEEAESLRAEVEALRLEVAGARADAAADARRAAVLEESMASMKRAAAEAQSIAGDIDDETQLATHAAIEASVTDAIGLAVDVDETDGDAVDSDANDGEDPGLESPETPIGATIARAGTPPLPPAAADSPSRRAQLNAAVHAPNAPVSSAPRAPSPLGLNAVHGPVATGSLAVDPRERPSPPEEGSLAAALEQTLPINGGGGTNKMPSRNSSACASANSLASIAEGSSGEEEDAEGEDADADATDGEASVDSPCPAFNDMAKGGGFAELETELALRRKLAREASRKAQSLSQECQTLSAALEEAKSAASRFEKRAAAAEKIAANAISHAETEEERHAAWTAELTERCEALSEELHAAKESRDAAVKKVEELELRLVDIASDGASATNTRPNTPSPVKGENDPAELVTVEETAEPASEVSEVRLSINVVDVASREREDHLLARAELAESAVAELRAKLESANVRVAAAEDELRAARKTVEETAKTVEETAEETAKTTEELRTRVNALDAALVNAKDEADAYRSALADAEAKLVSSAEAEKLNHQSLVRRVDAAEKDLADALARCADMSERRDAAELRAASAGAAADSAAAAAAESHAAMLDAERRAEDVKREMEDVKRGAEAEADALGARLEAALTELADARALAVGLVGFANADDDGHPDPESFPSDAAEDGSESAEEKDPASPGGSGSGSIVVAGAPAELLEELVRRRVREAQLEADAAKLRVQLDAAESRLRRTRAELEDSAGKIASSPSGSGAGSAAGSDADPELPALASELAEYKAKCAHLRSMLDAKEEALEEVERRARSAAEAAASFAALSSAETPTRSPPVEKITQGADPGADQGAVDAAVVEAAVEKRLAAVGSIIETWRRAVEAKELEIGALAAKIDELEASAANHAENSGTTNGDDERARARLDAAEREVRDAADKLAAALLASEDPARTDLAPISKTKKMPLGVAADAAVARLAYLAKRAEVHESETRGREVDARTHEAAMAKADARLAELARALKESAESEGKALAAAAQSEAAKASAEAAFEKCVDDLRAAERTAEELRARVASAGDSRERDQGGQARALMLQAECSELRAKVEKRNREVRELNQMLKAWEAMRHSKDQQIAQLVERCRKFEEEAADKARAIDAMRSRLGRDGQPGGASVGAGSVGSVSFNRTPRRSPTGTSMRLSPSPAPSSVSSFAFGTRAPSGGAAPSPVNVDKENPERLPSATKRFAAMAALGGESPGRPAGGGVKGSIDAEVFARVGGGVGASPRGGVPSPKRALRTIGR